MANDAEIAELFRTIQAETWEQRRRTYAEWLADVESLWRQEYDKAPEPEIPEYLRVSEGL